MSFLRDPASIGGVVMSSDWGILAAAGAFVLLYVYACIFWCMVRYRRRDGRQAEQFQGNPPLEIAYAAIPLLMVVGLFIVTYVKEMPVDRVMAHPAERIDVTAFRWSWRFAYPGGLTVTGTPLAPPTLYLPAGETTEIRLTSVDVTHSFWVPAMLFKRDAIPGMTNVFDLQPRRTGSFLSRCAQFCGMDHALMSFTLRVVPPRAYDRYVASAGAQTP